MSERNYKAFIVEGAEREPEIINNMSKVFFSHGNYKIITLPAGENIYMLWKKLREDDFDTDIIEVLRETSDEIKKQLEGLSREDFSEVFLFFDYDAHQTNLSKNDDPHDAMVQMLKSFDNETENGKLYINYPMVEALRDYETGVCGNRENCYVLLDEMGEYKRRSAERSTTPQFNKFGYEQWSNVIGIFAMRVACLFGLATVMAYEDYMEYVNPLAVYSLEERKVMEKQGVFVLSAFPEFLVDYFGIKIWKNCIKQKRNRVGEVCL